MTTSTTPTSNMLQPPIQATPTQISPTSTPQVFDGPITRSRAKKLQQEVNGYFVKFILILMRIIYCLSRVCWYCSGSLRRIKDHTRTRPVMQNSLKEAVITFDSQKL